MKIRIKDKTIFLSDDSDMAKKIRDGYDCDLDAEGKLKVLKTKDCLNNKYQILAALKKASSIDDMKAIVGKLVEMVDSFV